jgi:ribosomal protein S27AE
LEVAVKEKKQDLITLFCPRCGYSIDVAAPYKTFVCKGKCKKRWWVWYFKNGDKAYYEQNEKNRKIFEKRFGKK